MQSLFELDWLLASPRVFLDPWAALSRQEVLLTVGLALLDSKYEICISMLVSCSSKCVREIAGKPLEPVPQRFYGRCWHWTKRWPMMRRGPARRRIDVNGDVKNLCFPVGPSQHTNLLTLERRNQEEKHGASALMWFAVFQPLMIGGWRLLTTKNWWSYTRNDHLSVSIHTSIVTHTKFDCRKLMMMVALMFISSILVQWVVDHIAVWVWLIALADDCTT